MLSILYDDFDWKLKNIYLETELHYSYKKKRVAHEVSGAYLVTSNVIKNFSTVQKKEMKMRGSKWPCTAQKKVRGFQSRIWK